MLDRIARPIFGSMNFCRAFAQQINTNALAFAVFKVILDSSSIRVGRCLRVSICRF